MNNLQFHLFLIFIANGVLIGLLFDSFRILRKTIKTSDLITYIEDALFWILTGCIILYSIFIYNNGEIRLFMFLAIIIGVLMYYFTISKYILKFSLNIINFFKKILYTILRVIKIPFEFLIKILRRFFFRPIEFIIINIRKIIKKNLDKFIILLKKTKISNKYIKKVKK